MLIDGSNPEEKADSQKHHVEEESGNLKANISDKLSIKVSDKNIKENDEGQNFKTE